MSFTRSLFDGAQAQWAGWFLLLMVWMLWTPRLFRRDRRSSLWQVVRGEAGLSYAMGFVLTVPIYSLLCLTIVESTLLLSAKVGTVCAAYAGARSAAVWEAFPALKQDRLEQSVVSNLTPFVLSGEDSTAGSPRANAQAHAQDYVKVLEKFREKPVIQSVMLPHFRRVASRTQVTVDIPRKRQGQDATCTVEYRAPFLTPGVGRLFDPDGREPFEIPIRSTVTLTLEFPKSANGSLGIAYKPF
jgi:hypothetical protein